MSAAMHVATTTEMPVDTFAQIGAFLRTHRLGADPANYAFAYSVVADPEGTVAAEVMKLSEGGFRLSGEDVVRLGGRPAAGAPVRCVAEVSSRPQDTMGAADALVARTQVQVDGFRDTVREISDATRGFGRDLAAAIEPEAVQSIGVVALAAAMIERVRLAEARLDEATREADALRAALDEARGSARRDPLTDLANRRAFDEAFDALDGTRAAAVAICDVDHFKRVNDGFGHAVGDRVLRAIGQSLAQTFAGSLVARYGGEEFVILMLDAGDPAALVEEARERIAARRFRVRETGEALGTITLSAGIARIGKGERREAALSRADAALYAAKKAGRNCVEVAPEVGE